MLPLCTPISRVQNKKFLVQMWNIESKEYTTCTELSCGLTRNLTQLSFFLDLPPGIVIAKAGKMKAKSSM
jgi:hypothetical protein